MRDVLTLVLAGGKGKRLEPLTRDRAKPAVPFGGGYRIIDFALNFFGRYAENNRLADDEEGRTQFASFIGAAIAQGISEAEGILSALNATSESGGFDIGFTRSLIQERLDNFVANGL